MSETSQVVSSIRRFFDSNPLIREEASQMPRATMREAALSTQSYAAREGCHQTRAAEARRRGR
jgi:hypothetical protein